MIHQEQETKLGVRERKEEEFKSWDHGYTTRMAHIAPQGEESQAHYYTAINPIKFKV